MKRRQNWALAIHELYLYLPLSDFSEVCFPDSWLRYFNPLGLMLSPVRGQPPPGPGPEDVSRHPATDILCRWLGVRWLTALCRSCSVSLCYSSPLNVLEDVQPFLKSLASTEIFACLLVCVFIVRLVTLWPGGVPFTLEPLTSLKSAVFPHKGRVFYAPPEFSSPKHGLCSSPRSPATYC